MNQQYHLKAEARLSVVAVPRVDHPECFCVSQHFDAVADQNAGCAERAKPLVMPPVEMNTTLTTI